MKYKRIWVNGKMKRLSRIIMESHLERKLKPTEVVHHIDGNPNNDNISNLKIVTPEEHNFIHHQKGDYHRGHKKEKEHIERQVNREVSRNTKKATPIIMELLSKRKYPAQIARELNISKSALSKRMKKMVRDGLIEEKYRTSYKGFELTDKGKTIMSQSKVNLSSSSVRGKSSIGNNRVDIHHIQLKFPILREGRDLDWKEWKLKNWTPKYKKVPILGASFTKTTNAMVVNIYSKKVSNPNEIYRIVNIYTMLAMSYLKDSFDMEIDPIGMEVTAIEFQSKDPIAEEIVKKGHRPKISLGRMREKISPNDPDQEAFVWADNTPFAGRETNDLVHEQRWGEMPETVHRIASEMIPLIEDFRDQWRSHKPMVQTATELNKETTRLMRLMIKRITKKVPDMTFQRGLGDFV